MKVNLTITMDEDLKKKLQHYAIDRNMTVSEVITDLVEKATEE